MLGTKLYYLDCNIRVCNPRQRREAPVFSGRIWFNSLVQFIEAVEQKLQSFVSTVDQMKIWYRKHGGKYRSIHVSEQEFLDTCSNSNVIVSYFLHGPSPSPIKKSPPSLAQKADSFSENIVSIVLNLKDTFSTWSGPNQSWIELAQYYKASHLTGTEVVDIPQSYRSLFTVEQDKAANSVGVNTLSVGSVSVSTSMPPVVAETITRPSTNERTSSSKGKAKSANVSTTTLPVSVTEVGTEMDVNLLPQPRNQLPYSFYVDSSQYNSIYQQHFVSQPIGPAVSMEKNHSFNSTSDLSNLRAHKSVDQSDSLVHLTIPKVSAKAAYIITGVVYADMQAREGV
ncbi:Hypothetical protein GLP15_4610 [Giardia lamblia P15]|uniref:Uncharacterized protein n=1 Tax=Giardia intestinalis (strain P15) TaxID=658858 RepID=E1F7P0_GIAIA|nr:Hypothetical protein GLP15_4610 [Giardia lamblia P15]